MWLSFIEIHAPHDRSRRAFRQIRDVTSKGSLEIAHEGGAWPTQRAIHKFGHFLP